MFQGPVDGLPLRPLLKPWYRLARPDGRLVLEYGGRLVLLEGRATERLLPALLPLLDGERTVDEIVAALGGPAAPAVEQALRLLDRHALLADGHRFGADAPALDSIRFLAATSSRQRTLAETEAAVRDARVGVIGSGTLASEIGRAARLCGVRSLEPVPCADGDAAKEADLVLVAPTAEELPELGEWNLEALRVRVPWLQVLPHDGRFAAIGPLYVPRETCCYECFRLRRASNSGFEEEFWALQEAPRSLPVSASTERAAAAIAAELALRWLVDRPSTLPGVLYALEVAPAPALTHHVVYRVPRCPACSLTATVAPVLPWHQGDG